MASKDIRLAIQIAGEIDKSLGDSIDVTKKELRKLAIDVAKSQKQATLSGAIDSMSDGIEGITKNALGITKAVAGAAVGAGAALTGVGVAAVNAGADFESAFAGIRKTVDATEQEYAQLEDSIRSMAKNMPMAATELAEIGESAGQLGIHKENLEDFIETMADLSVSTNLTSEDAATQFAKFANITGMQQDKFDELGSSVVALGNNMATTEADIMSMAMRLAGAGTQIGMSEADILGLSAALSSVGIEAEMGGSALSKTMINMQLAVEQGADPWKDFQDIADQTGRSLADVINTVTVGGNGLKYLAQQVGMSTSELKGMKEGAEKGQAELESYAEIAGMASDEFAKLFKSNPAEALSEFITGIGNVERNGKSAIMVLDDMGITEVRQRDALLRAASASDLFANSLQIANESFEENTALAKEAEQRYATFESRLQMVQHRVNDVGISLYQNFRDPLNDVMGIALDETADFAIFDPDTMEAMADAAREHIPTAVREIREGATAFSDFAGPVMSGVINNLDLIGSGIVGIGTAIAALNIIKKVNDLYKAMGAMRTVAMANPFTLWVAGGAALAGVIAGVITKYKLWREEEKKSNLNKHFGEIALSMDELEDAARQIVNNGNLDRVNQALEEMEKTEDSAKSIRNLSQEINKMVWKIGTGFELNESDQESLKASIDSMVTEAVSLVEQANYTATISVQALFGTDSQQGQEIIAGFNAMYSQIDTEVSELGRQLGEAYSKAMEDGVIDLDEANVINELQGKLAKITAEVSQSQFEAKMQRIGIEYGGKDLTAESFQNLQAEIAETINEQTANQTQSLEYALGQLNLQRKRSITGEIAYGDEAYLDKQAYDEAMQSLQNQYNSQQMEIQSKGLGFSADAIMSAYADELAGAVPDMQSNLQEVLESAISTMETGGNGLLAWDPQLIYKTMGFDEMDQAARDAIRELWDGAMQEQFQALQEAVQQAQLAGQEVPEAIAEGLRNAATVGAIAGDTDAIYQLLAETASGSSEYQEALKAAEEAGYKIPESVSLGINDSESLAQVDTAVDELYQYTQNAAEKAFSGGLVLQVDTYMALSPLMDAGGTDRLRNYTGGSAKSSVQKHAEGGILTSPHLGLVAEDGPEAIIPLDGSSHAKSIWEQAGEALGLLSGGSGSGASYSSGGGESEDAGQGAVYQIYYSPVFQGGNEDSMRQAAEDGYEQFKEYMAQFVKDNRRLSFS